jgi:FkbM family methyltransferase
MNRFERLVDGLSPALSVRLRIIKKLILGEEGLLLLPRLVSRGDVVVDVGANRGLYAHRLSQLVGPTGHVHVFEPLPDNVRVLEAVRAGRTNMTIYPLALSDHEGQAALHVPVYQGHAIDALASLREPSLEHETVKVPLARLDEVLVDAGRPVSFLKCDVEGHEAAMLRGAEGLLRTSMPTILIEIEQRHQAENIQRTFDYLTDLGYQGFFFDRTTLRGLEEFDASRHQLSYLTEEFVPAAMPAGYVNDFLFVSRARTPQLSLQRR